VEADGVQVRATVWGAATVIVAEADFVLSA
jgi:hypothetical protein